MRNLLIVALLSLASTSTLACVFDSNCPEGQMCLDGTCSGDRPSDNERNASPTKRATTWKTCSYDGDCDRGSRCIKGSGTEGVCLGR